MSFNPPPGKGCFTINAIAVDIGDHTIRQGKEIRRIEPKAMHVLYILACNPNDTVERAELLRDVWNGRIVVEEALTRIISQLRQALGDSKQRSLIQTVPKKGYRLRGEVIWQTDSTTTSHAASDTSVEIQTNPAVELEEDLTVPSPQTTPSTRPGQEKAKHDITSTTDANRKKALWVGLILVVVAIAAFMLSESVPHDEARLETEQRVSVAVLPLRQLSNDNDTLYFADGITEELTDSLTQNRNLDVPSRYSTLAVSRTSDSSLTEVAKTLGVRYLVEGSVRRIDDEFKIAVRLVDAKSDRVVWSESYTNTASGLFAIQQTIAQRLNEALLPQTSENSAEQSPPIDNFEAYQYYLRGNYWLMNGKTSEWIYRSEAALQKAVELAPDFAAAHGKLAYLYARYDFHDAFMPRDEAMQKADAAITTALRYDPTDTNALLASAIIATSDGDFSLAETLLDGVLQRRPKNATALYIYSELELARNRFDVALTRAKQAYELDPLSPWINVNLAIVHFWRSEYQDALKATQNAISIDGNYTWAYVWQAKIYQRQGELSAAIQSMLHSADIDSASEVNSAYTGLLYMELGDETEADRWFKHTASQLGDSPQARFWQGFLRFTKPQQNTVVAQQLLLDLPLLDNRIFTLLPLLYQHFINAEDKDKAIKYLKSTLAHTAPEVNIHNYRFYAALQALEGLPEDMEKSFTHLVRSIGDNASPLAIYPILAQQTIPRYLQPSLAGWLDYYWLVDSNKTTGEIHKKLLSQHELAARQRALLKP